MSVFGAGIADLADQGLLPTFALLELREVTVPTPAAASASTVGDIFETVPVVSSAPTRILAAYRFPLAPTDARTDLEPSIAITRTQGGTTREHSGPRMRRITFAGQVGLVARLGSDAEGNMRYLPSRQLFEELRKFLERYLLLAARSPLASPKPKVEYELVLRYFDRDLHYVVEPKAFAAIQDERNRTTFRYELSFETIEEARSLRARNWLDDVIDTSNKGLAYFNKAAEYVGIATGLINGLSVALTNVKAAIEAPFVLFRAATDTLFQARGNVDAVLAIPDDLALQCATATYNLAAAFGTLQEEMSAAEREEAAPQLVDIQASLDDTRNAMAGLAVALRQPRSTAPGSLPAPYQVHTVRAGEDLGGIAYDRLGDEARAGEIANLNRLQPPYLSVAGLPGTAAPGDLLILPADATPDGAGTAPGATVGGDDALYGIDLRLDGGDLLAVNVGGAELDDFALQRGVDNVRDALQRRSQTVLGENRVFPLLGLPSLVGETNDRIGPWLLSHLVEQLQRDDRVRRVESPSLVDGGDVAEVELTAVLVDGRRAPVSAAA